MSDISNNDLRQCEAMLYCQAHVLQAVFVDSLLQVPKQGWFSTSEAYMRMAMKAQNQCRMTLQTWAQIKNPPVVFARQANIAQGPQQVNNNGMMPAGEPRLLPDTGAPGAAVGSDPAVSANPTPGLLACLVVTSLMDGG
jgi:hypothetical protein